MTTAPTDQEVIVSDGEGGFQRIKMSKVVRAVNAHDELVAAMHELIPMAEQLFDDKDGDGDPLGKYRAALAKAEGR